MKKTLRRKLAHLWPEDHDRDEAIRMLTRYGTESWEREVERVHLAILKLAEGRLETLPECVEAAKRDYRDVLYWAESPELSRAGGWTSKRNLSPTEAQTLKAMRKRDRHQYEKWLEEE